MRLVEMLVTTTSMESAFSSQVNYFGVARQPGAIAITSLQADFPLLIAVSERQITSVWPTVYPELWSSFSRRPFQANFLPTIRDVERLRKLPQLLEP